MLSSLLALIALYAQNAYCRPTGAIPIEITSELVQRSESGPLGGGANFPDPAVIQVGSTWYSFATRNKGSSTHIQIARSADFNSWTILQKDALPNLPAWVYQSSANTWAPDIVQLTDGSFVMYYSATTKQDTAKHCIGAATSSNIEGPYTAVGANPLICTLAQGGAIDSAGFYDGGPRYVVYKIDGNSIGHGGACGNNVAPYVSTAIMLQPVGADGVTLSGSAVKLLDNNGAGDNGIVEAPSITKVGSTYVLFFSSGCYTTGSYSVDYATASNIRGPYTRASRPLFQTGDRGLSAPGGADVFRDGKHMLFHANSGSGRALYSAVITISGNSVSA